MRKILCSLLAMCMIISTVCIVGAAGDIVLTGADAAYKSGIEANQAVIKGFAKGDYVGFSKVDLTGIKSIRLDVFSNYSGGANCEIFQVRIDSPDKGGKAIGYVRADNNKRDIFSCNISDVTGPHDLYFVSQFSHSEQLSEIYSITLSTQAVNNTYEPVPESTIIDNYHDTWVSTDDMGRKVADYEEVGDVKDDSYIGMFYWNWFTNPKMIAYIPSEINAQHPEAYADYNNPVWDSNGKYFWSEPLFGFYEVDYWVYRKQAAMMADAGVDVIFFDYTNGDACYYNSLKTLLEAFRDARGTGIDSPKVSAITSWKAYRINSIKFMYEEIFREGRYNDLWFYWEGKPMLISDVSTFNPKYEYPDDSVDVALTDEMYDFFTFKEMGDRGKGQTRENQLMWLESYPQHKYMKKGSDRVEFMDLGSAVNESYVWGVTPTGVFSDPYTKGRSYTEAFGEDFTEGAYRQNYFFKEQVSRVLDSDPHFVFVDGWNEWSAGRQQLYSGVENCFVDTYDNEGSRDIEPSRGALGDDSYNMFVDFSRKYKGARPAPTATAQKTIDINKGNEQWSDVGPEFINDYDDYTRDADGYNPHHYTTTVVNSISRAKVARDQNNFYFYVKTTKDIKTGTDNWMQLYINTDRNHATGWQGYDYTLNVTGAGQLSKNVGNTWNWEKVSDVSYTVSKDILQVSIPRSLIGETGTADFEFKWSDDIDVKGDLLNFYTNGSAAPLGRFNYLYTEIQQTSVTKEQRAALKDTTILKADTNKMIVNGGKMNVYEPDTRVKTTMINGVLYFPAESLNDILGYGRTKIEWDSANSRLFVSNHVLDSNDKIADYVWAYSTVGSLEVRLNGYLNTLQNPIKIVGGLVYVPITYLQDCFGWTVKDAENGYYAAAMDTINPNAVAAVKSHIQ
ncbi:MAG: stalk domain-containing protein [Bacillota bacterium]|nr:stalk domain-containing protein [Bacillota bacterium]